MGAHDCLFAAMNQVAATLCVSSTFIDDLQIEFRQLQKVHYPDLTKEEWLELFGI
jgi:hypothetical protein